MGLRLEAGVSWVGFWVMCSWRKGWRGVYPSPTRSYLWAWGERQGAGPWWRRGAPACGSRRGMGGTPRGASRAGPRSRPRESGNPGAACASGSVAWVRGLVAVVSVRPWAGVQTAGPGEGFVGCWGWGVGGGGTLVQITYTLFLRRTSWQCWHIRFTDTRTFMVNGFQEGPLPPALAPLLLVRRWVSVRSWKSWKWRSLSLSAAFFVDFHPDQTELQAPEHTERGRGEVGG